MYIIKENINWRVKEIDCRDYISITHIAQTIIFRRRSLQQNLQKNYNQMPTYGDRT